MARHIYDRGNPNFKAKQKGITLILFVFILGLAITSLSLKLFSASNMRAQREIKSTQALDNAKSAVIANVVSGLSGSGLGQFPCDEDTTLIGFNTEGQARGTCNGAPVVGRFAWRSLNTGDIRDGNTDKLWYVLSTGYRATPVNSDTVPTLTVNGVSNKAIAILFSPGTVLQSQSRPVPTSTSPPVVSQYMELENSNADNVFTLASPSSSFNDQGLTIEPDDVYPLLEKRVLKEFKSFLNVYKATWGAFPYPSTFTNPNKTINTFVGTVGTKSGFLPVAASGITTTWNTATVPVPTISAPLGNLVTSTCSFRTSNTRIRCDVTILLYNAASPPTISFTGVVDNISTGFYDGLLVTNAGDIQITTRSGTAIVTGATLGHSLDNTGKGYVTFTGTLLNTGVVRIEYRRAPPQSNWVLSATNHYLLANNWHQLVSYQVAAPYLPGGSQSCTGNCLTINRLDVTPNTAVTNVHALLITAGRKLVTTNYRPAPTFNAANPAQNRPSAALADYFDSNNNVSAGLTFDMVVHGMGTFNDQIEMVE